MRQRVGPREDDDPKALLRRVAFPVGGRHAEDAAANDLEGLAQFGALHLALTVLGKRMGQRIA